MPLIFLKGVSGVLFKELAYVIIFALICSLLVSLSLVPMLASRLINTIDGREKEIPVWMATLSGFAEAFFVHLNSGYENLIRSGFAKPEDHRGSDGHGSFRKPSAACP